jgi:SPP1 gp7 family putative phage head morphogenesis protein
VRKNAELIAARPGDTSVWFPTSKYNRDLTSALQGHLSGVADTVNTHIRTILPTMGKAGPPVAQAAAVERVLRRGAARVSKINETTRQAIADVIAETLANDSVSGGISLFDEYRAEMIARTEVMDAYNSAALGSYTEAGIEQVQAIDGDGDEECAARDGEIFDVDEADGIEDHPNGTLDWVPVVGKAELEPPYVINRPAVVNVTINPTVQAAEAPSVEVHPAITVKPAAVVVPAPSIVVNVPEPKPVTRRIERDADGRPSRLVEE